MALSIDKIGKNQVLGNTITKIKAYTQEIQGLRGA
jgi:hypothetical protein